MGEKMITSTINVIVSIFNIILIILFYVLDRRYRKNEKEMDRGYRIQEEKMKRVSFWFREIILTRINEIDYLYNTILDIIREIECMPMSDYSDDKLSEQIRLFKSKLRNLNNGFIDRLRIMDKSFAAILDKIIDTTEDTFINRLALLQKVKDAADRIDFLKKLTIDITDQRENFVTSVYQYEINNYNYKTIDYMS